MERWSKKERKRKREREREREVESEKERDTHIKTERKTYYVSHLSEDIILDLNRLLGLVLP